MLVWPRGCHFVLWVVVQSRHCLFCSSASASALGTPRGWLLSFDMSSLCVALSYFLAPQCNPSLSCIFPAPVPDLLISPGSPHSFSWNMIFRDHDLGTGVRIAAEVLMLLAPPSGQSQGICAGALTAHAHHDAPAFTSASVICVHIKNCEFVLVSPVWIQHSRFQSSHHLSLAVRDLALVTGTYLHMGSFKQTLVNLCHCIGCY